jgi:Lon protease-like protein
MSGGAANPLDAFNGTARLFPLPNLVLFPYVIQPLHVFEPRYRQLTEDALAGDRLLAMALLRPGWEEEYHGKPAIYPVACLACVRTEERLPDGRFNLFIQGVCRARLGQEMNSDRLYRTARARLLKDVPVATAEAEEQLRSEMAQRLVPWSTAPADALGQLRQVMHGNLPLGALADLYSFALPLEVEAKQALLQEPDVERRVHRLLTYLETLRPAPAVSKFPPEFSAN